MKEALKQLGWSLLGLAVLPVAKLSASGLVWLVNQSPRQEDNDWLVALSKELLKKREEGSL